MYALRVNIRSRYGWLAVKNEKRALEETVMQCVERKEGEGRKGRVADEFHCLAAVDMYLT